MDQNKKLQKRGELYLIINKMLHAQIDVHSDKVTYAIRQLNKMHNKCFSAFGLNIKRRCLSLLKYQQLAVPKDSLKANSFLRRVHDMIKQNPSWEQQIEINLWRHSIAEASGSARGATFRNIVSTNSPGYGVVNNDEGEERKSLLQRHYTLVEYLYAVIILRPRVWASKIYVWVRNSRNICATFRKIISSSWGMQGYPLQCIWYGDQVVRWWYCVRTMPCN